MKKYLIIVFVVSFFLTISCNNKRYNNFYYLKIENNTSHQVKMRLRADWDTTVLKEYLIQPYQSSFIDTTIFETNGGNGLYRIIKGEGFTYTPYWDSNNSLLQYQFDDLKKTDYIKSAGFSTCDSSIYNTTYLCHIVKIERENVAETKTELGYLEDIRTFYITEQQFIVADSI